MSLSGAQRLKAPSGPQPVSRPPLYEITLSYSDTQFGLAELLRSLLSQAGIPAGAFVQVRQDAQESLVFYLDTASRVAAITRKLSSLRFKGVSVRSLRLESQDWQSRWKEEFKPFFISGAIKIVPLWMRDDKRSKDKACILIDTDTVFGTGLHPTTRLMAGLIAQKKGRFRTFLDVGTGTGILSLIAAQCKAREVWAIDACEDAVAIAKRNFRVNRLKPVVLKQIALDRWEVKKQFDFVAANLFSEILIDSSARLIRLVAPGKYLAVSGIAAANYRLFRERFKDRRLFMSAQR